MEVINNFISGNQRKSRNDSTVSNTSGSVRHKWRLMRTKPTKKSDPDIELNNSEPSSENPNDSLPGIDRVLATDSCIVCANDVEYVYVLSKCGHRACIDCWRRFAYSQVSSFAMAHITCIACDRRLSRALIIQLLKPRPLENGGFDVFPSSDLQQAEKIYRRYEDFLLRQCLSRDKRTRWCPRGCGYALLAGRGFRNCPRIKCEHPDCDYAAFCYKCHASWGPIDMEHVCKGSSRGAVGTTEGGASSSGGTAGDFFTGENPRSLLSQLRQFFRLPSASAVATDAVAGATASSRRSRRRGPTEDIESGTWSSIALTTASARKFSTTAMPLQGDDNSDQTINTDDEIEKNVFAYKGADANISKIKLDLPENVSGEVKACPRCHTLLLKLDDGSCNHMSCFICGCEFCWLCLREVRDTHFLSPTGCTFWGRQRWPFRRRIWAMLIAAFGTPFILAIVTALAIPGIVIGFPAYVSYKVGQRIRGGKCKRILLKTLAFFGGLLVSPIIAALVTIFGIPLVLIYVYIFMPITLFSELKVRLSTNNPSNTQAKAIDPEVGFKINWEQVGEAAAAAASVSTADTPKHLPGDASTSDSSSRPNSLRCNSTTLKSSKRHRKSDTRGKEFSSRSKKDRVTPTSQTSVSVETLQEKTSF
ncbi:unnamed protein product [Hymenolepis diminuta]|uniref:RBR-type E3 ubiquitin transferase n=1 Tax=Hymenolepis diminuta TaxID=6216 RepID=A0A564Y3C3_HYMDI|nr:unnamed protein product [Hymenolepis diminuta]